MGLRVSEKLFFNIPADADILKKFKDQFLMESLATHPIFRLKTLTKGYGIQPYSEG